MLNTFKRSTVELLSESKKQYLQNILDNREYFKEKGYIEVSIEYNWIHDNEIGVYMRNEQDIAIQGLYPVLNNEVIERIKL